ncbi:MAG: EamA family transporter [Candidatus Pacebacteria bacterium]|jgi:uncharacterized membrane protein|nr:EamA family transporter [Candidatus Paceibacterota bacterium]MBT4005106.1 EamA family transporter [Candidatus Paceibacterota bacterium]MBT6898787.1 EamA family transporter [Candidatus Paceibacterota bacterium]
MWIFYSFLTAALETVRDVMGKKSAQKTDEYLASFGIQFFGLLVIVPMLMVVGIPEVKPIFWWAAAAGLITVPLGNILYMRAVKSADLSMVVPMLAFNPFFTALITILFEKTFPSMLGWVGIMVVGMGLYSLRLGEKALSKGVLGPLLQIRHDPNAMAMLGVALIWSVGANLAKVLVMNSSPLFTAFIGASSSSLVLFIIVAGRAKFKLLPVMKSIRNNLLSLSSLGIGVGLSNMAMFMALSQGFTPYVISIKRVNIVFSSIAGKIFFKEKLSKNKILGIVLMFVGLVLIILG